MPTHKKKEPNNYTNDLTDSEVKEILAKIDSEMVGMDFSKVTELEALDPKLYSLLRKHIYKEPPGHLRLKILESIRKEKGKSGKRSFSKFNAQVFQSVGFPQFSMAKGMVILFIVSISSVLAYLLYYQYENNKNINPNTIVNQQTPSINITPSPAPSVSPNPEIKPLIKPNIINDGNQKNDIVKDQNKSNKTNKIKNNSSNKKMEDNKVVYNSNNPKDFISVEDVSKEDRLRGSIVDLQLLEITQFYVASFGEKEEDKLLRQALIQKLQKEKFQVLSSVEALSLNNYGKIIKKDNFIQILNPNNNNLLWSKPIEKNSSIEEISNIMIEALLEDTKTSQEQ